jgi:hypothetical protein
MENFRKQSRVARTRREEALKLKDLKELQFGEYVTLVPAFNLARHFDRPLPDSTAKLCADLPSQGCLEATLCIPGQQLYGVMIPRPQEEAIRRSLQVKNDQDLLQAVCSHIQKLKKERHGQIVSFAQDYDHGASDEPAGYELLQCNSATDLSPKINWDNFLYVNGMKLCIMQAESRQMDNSKLRSENEGYHPLLFALHLTPNKLLPVENPLHLFRRDAARKGNTLDVNNLISRKADLPKADIDEQEDEGVEVVAWGELNILEDQQRDYLEGTDGAIGGLSSLYQASATVFVAFYRPRSSGRPTINVSADWTL